MSVKLQHLHNVRAQRLQPIPRSHADEGRDGGHLQNEMFEIDLEDGSSEWDIHQLSSSEHRSSSTSVGMFSAEKFHPRRSRSETTYRRIGCKPIDENTTDGIFLTKPDVVKPEKTWEVSAASFMCRGGVVKKVTKRLSKVAGKGKNTTKNPVEPAQGPRAAAIAA